MSAKIRDNKNRWRNKTVGFRVSPEEWEEIERLVRLSGMSKQEYIMSRLENREMVINVTPRIIKAVRLEILALTNELKQLSGTDMINQELIDRLGIITKLIAH